MTQFNDSYNAREKDPRIMVRAAMFYYQQLDLHLKNVQHLSQETIKYYTDRLLEITLFLEEFANKIYEDLSDEERHILEMAEEKRNENLYVKPNGSVDERSVEYIRTLIKSATERYDGIRKEAEEKINKPE